MISMLNGQIENRAKTRLERFLQSARKQANVPGEVNILFAEQDEVRRLNREYRGKNKATDVLSFPAAEVPGGGRLIGDIVVCVDIARANANSLGHSLEDELKILLLHGLLHLAGHDHESDNGKMAALEQKLRAKLKLPTGLIERTTQNGKKHKTSKSRRSS